jgi:hypothetical protein
VFVGCEGFDGPFIVKAVRKRDVDCVDRGVVEEVWDSSRSADR